jgi:putative DNA primase/helicase
VIEALIGANDCSHVSLQDLAENRFARARLFGKKLNTYGDLPAIPIKDTGIFKNLTGQDTIDAENKFEQIFSFRNRAKLLYSANRLPMLKYEDDAFYNRWIIVPFENSIYGKEDPDLTAKLTTPTELSGILNFGLEGLKQLRANNWHFSYGETESGELYRRASNPLVAFLEDMCIPSDEYVVKAELVKAFNQYAREKGLPPATSNKAFGIAMQDQMIIPVETKHPKVGGSQVEAWSGISLRKENQ